jgi:outer membrane lipoprotein SlyB
MTVGTFSCEIKFTNNAEVIRAVSGTIIGGILGNNLEKGARSNGSCPRSC